MYCFRCCFVALFDVILLSLLILFELLEIVTILSFVMYFKAFLPKYYKIKKFKNGIPPRLITRMGCLEGGGGAEAVPPIFSDSDKNQLTKKILY